MSEAPASHDLHQKVSDFWNAAPCGIATAVGQSQREAFETQARERYRHEPFILDFAGFEDGAGKDVLEIGVGMGADHTEWAKRRPRRLVGVDLTPKAIELTSTRIAELGLESHLEVGDAENLSFADESFDIVYSWGVLHHSPDTPRAVREVHRVLKPGGRARIMVYHTWALVGFMLWARYALLAGKPFRPLSWIYSKYLESPGTKAYTRKEAAELFRDFKSTRMRIEFSPGDLLVGVAGQRHRGGLLSFAKKVWPRWLIRRAFPNLGLFLLIEAER